MLGLSNKCTQFDYLLFIAFSFNAGTEKDAASYARYLMRHGMHGVFSTQMADVPQMSIAMMDDFSESSKLDGNPVFMLADISETTKNLDQYPFGSFTIAANNCTVNDFDGMPYDPLACLRFTMTGRFIPNENAVNITDPEFLSFSSRHPAASDWVKYSPHQFRMWTMNIFSIYYVGGYGNLHYIGEIDTDMYAQAEPVEPN